MDIGEDWERQSPVDFLSGSSLLGSLVMGLTAVCPLVDNTTTGTATCKNNTPSTDAFASGAVPWASWSVLYILNFAATTPSPFNGSTANSIWYGGDRTKEEIRKDIIGQIINRGAFSP